MDNKELRHELAGNLENLIGTSNKVAENGIGLFQKKSKQGGWGYGISRGIKEIACGSSRGQLKTKWNFQGWPRKNNVEFPGVSVFGLGISKGSNTILWNIQGI